MARLTLENTTEEAWNLWLNKGTPGCLSEGALQKSALEEHARENHHPIKWEDVTVIDCARTATTAERGHPHLLHSPGLNRDEGIELPRCWMAALKVQERLKTLYNFCWCNFLWQHMINGTDIWVTSAVANLPSPWKSQYIWPKRRQVM